MKHADVPPAPRVATLVFGDRLAVAEQYAEILAGDGVERGLLGPREADRIWERHLMNSVAVAELIDPGGNVADLGSGAGLPGIPLALARPDLRVTLIEPLLRRSEFLREVVDELRLECEVVRARAEDLVTPKRAGTMDAVVSRAVAPLDKLARWSMPLLRPGGRMVAIKGQRAAAEVDEHRHQMAAAGAVDLMVMRCAADDLELAATVVVAERGARPRPRKRLR